MNILEKLNAIKNQEITAKENVEAYLKVIEEKNEDINAFLELNKEAAIAKAEEIDAKIQAGEEVGALAGLVFGIKANINVEDLIISAASKTLEDYIGSYDATVVKLIKAEDGIIIGINNMDEFAAGSSTETSYYGAVNNPAAPGRIPGGSSGGSAAAVAPSSHCGVLGMKPTYGAVSRQGLLDLSMSLDQIGPMARDITGITLALDTIVAYDPTECTTLDWDAPNFTEIAESVKGEEKPLAGMKIATCKEFREVTNDEINGIVDESVAKLEELGAEVVELSFNYIDICLPTYYLINYVEFFSATRKYDGRKYGSRIEEVCGEEVLRRIQMGSYISQKEFSGKYYQKALQARTIIRNEINDMLEGVDLIVGPTVPKLPHKLGEKLEPMEMYAYDVLTVIANLAGIPAASVKAGEVEGIPVGLQLQAKPQDDAKIVKAMAAFEYAK